MIVDGSRADRLSATLAERGCDALLVTGAANVRWLTGFTGSHGAALVGSGSGAIGHVFATDFRYVTISAEQVSEVFERVIATDLIEALVAPVVGGESLRLGFDDAQLSVREHARLTELCGPGITLVAAGGAVEDLRVIKEPHEIERMRAAALLADGALSAVLESGLIGRTERAVALELEVRMRELGAESVSFSPIVAAGAHGALPHAEPRDVAIPANTLVVIDWGAQLEGYASDCTRTFATGPLSDHDASIYDLVLEAQLAALADVRAGRLGREVDAVARDVIEAGGHGEEFGHGLGHGVGIEVHEAPRLSRQGETALAPGMVVTVEPGVYVPGVVGVRIEDLVVVTDGAPDVLNSLTKELWTVS